MTPADPGPAGTTRTLLDDGHGGRVRRTVLPGGTRVVTESMPGVRSATIGVWVGVGSRDESREFSGASHFLEHLLFKGTARRSAVEISASLEAVGGEMNAFTAKEYTCFHARVIDTDLPLAVDVLGDMVTASRLDPVDVESEREVILEEIAMNDDDPDDVVHDLAVTQAWGDTPLGRPIAGEPERIRSMTREQVDGYYRDRYAAEAVVVAVAGNVEHDQVVALVAAAFGAGVPAGPGTSGAPDGSADVPVFRPGTSVAVRPTEQANVVMLLPGLARLDPRRHAAGVLTTALGGGMSSRLFQQVREVRGLAYSTYAFSSQHAAAGLWGVYAGCAPGKIEAVLGVVREELASVAAKGLTPDELERGKGQLRGSLVLNLEDPASRMSRIAKAELLHGEMPSIDDVLARIDGVTDVQVGELAAELFGAEPALAVVGPVQADATFAP